MPLLPAAPGNDFMDHCKYSSLLSNIKPTRLFFNWADRQALHMRIDWKQFYSQTLLDPYPSRYPGLVSMRSMPFGIPGYAKYFSAFALYEKGSNLKVLMGRIC